MLTQPSRPSGVDSKVTPVRPPPCHISSGYLPFLSFGRKYCTYICSTMYWPFGSSLVIGPPAWRWIIRTSLPETSAIRPPTWNEPMPRSTMSSAAAALKHAAAASTAPIRMRCIFRSPSVAQTFFDQPALDELGDLVAVLVHHHHVRIALEPRI